MPVFKRLLATQPQSEMPLTIVGQATGTSFGDLPYPDIDLETGSNEAADESPFVCMFEPVCRRCDNGCAPAGHKVV